MRLGGICFFLMWIPFTLLMIGLFQIGSEPQKVNGIDMMPKLMQYSLPPLGILFVLTFVLIISSFVVSAYQKNRIRKYGKPGKAKILSLFETGSTINQHPVVGFEMEVYPTSGAIFKTKTEQLIRRLDIPRVQPEMEVTIKYDPKTLRVIIV